jgi:hypothetical protein
VLSFPQSSAVFPPVVCCLSPQSCAVFPLVMCRLSSSHVLSFLRDSHPPAQLPFFPCPSVIEGAKGGVLDSMTVMTVQPPVHTGFSWNVGEGLRT